MTVETTTKKYTIAEFLALPKDGNHYELIDGELTPKRTGVTESHARITSRLNIFMGSYVLQNNLGEVYGSDARYAIVPGGDTIRLADVSFVQTSRVQRGVGTMSFAPDLAVEVLSDSNSYAEIETKVSQYFGKGSQLVWVINLDKQEVYVYRLGSNLLETLTLADELDGGTVLGGFKLPIARLFE